MADFDYGHYTQSASDLWRKIGELQGIDDALDLIKRVEAASRANMMAAEQQANQNAASGSGPGPSDTHLYSYIHKLHLGSTHPFTYECDVFVDDAGAWHHLDDQLDTAPALVTAGENGAVERSIGFNVRVLHIACGDVGRLRTLAEDFVHSVADPIEGGVSDDFAHLGGYQTHWEGDAAREFNRNFYGQFKQISDTHATIANGLAQFTAAVGKSLDLAQQSLQGLVDAATQVVDDQLQQRHDAHQSTSVSTKDWLSLGALVTGLASMLTIPVPGAAPTLAAVSRIFSFAGAVTPAAAPAATVPIKAQAAEELAGQLDQHSADLVRDWNHANDEIDTGRVEPFRSNVAEWDVLGFVNPPRLALQGDVPPGQFHYDGPSQ